MTKQKQTKPRTHEQRKTAASEAVTDSRKNYRGFKLVLLTLNHGLNSAKDPIYKPTFRTRKHHNETHIITNTMMKQSKGLNGDLKAEHKKTTNRTTIGMIIDIDSQASLTD